MTIYVAQGFRYNNIIKNRQNQSYFINGGSFVMMEDLLRIIKELGSEDLRLLYIVALELKKGK